MLFTVIASFVAKEFIDGFAILFIILIDCFIGAYQENKANNTVDAIEKLVKVKTNVIRNGKKIKIDSEDIVVGDIVLLESGDKISFDARVIESFNLTIDESVLTGESINVFKSSEVIDNPNVAITEQNNMVFAGTNVVSGRGKVVVCATSFQTELGKLWESMNDVTDELTPLTIRVKEFSKQIAILIVIIALFITLLLVYKEIHYQEIFLSVVALAVSAMPEGLSLALTMALSIAASKMAQKNVVIRKLNSVEALGSTTVIASDKTGTLTVNEQTAKKIILPNDLSYEITGTGYDFLGQVKGDNLNLAEEIALLGCLNNEAIVDDTNIFGDSIDVAFKVLGKKLNIDTSKYQILHSIPYESENKYSAVFYQFEDTIYCTVKGSLEVIKNFCHNISLLDEADFDKIYEQNENLARDGYRVIALASGKVDNVGDFNVEVIKNLTFNGLVGFIDPIRKEVKDSIKECVKAGIKVLMITGDHPLTAYNIAKELNITATYDEVTTGSEVEKYLNTSEKEFDIFIKKKKIFTRVTPLQKLEIINALKRNKEYVAVTGDGVNDAPALKSANIGIAMGSGTDLARETADIIVLDDNFNSIVKGIKEGRIAYANIRKIIYFLISCGLAEVLFYVLAILFNLPMPLVAIQLLWLNVVTDGIQDFALSFEKEEKDLMNESPRRAEEPLFDKILFQEIIFSGLVIGSIVFAVWYYLLNVVNMEVTMARAYIMTLMVFIQNIHVFNCRSEKKSAFSVSLFSNKLIMVAFASSIILQILVTEIGLFQTFLQTTSIPWNHFLYLFVIASLVLLIVECYKFIKYKRRS